MSSLSRNHKVRRGGGRAGGGRGMGGFGRGMGGFGRGGGWVGGAGMHGGWGPGWKPGMWGPGWGSGWSGTWNPGWACPYGGSCRDWNRWAYWKPEYYNNYLIDYPLNVSGNCLTQCHLDCNSENPGKGQMCQDECNSYCLQSYSTPVPCADICFQSCYKPGRSMAATCNDMCNGNPVCLSTCIEPNAPVDTPGFNACWRTCDKACGLNK